MSLYADDMLLYISDPSASFPYLLELLNEFGQLSSYKVSFQKSELMPIGTANPDTSLCSIPFKSALKKIDILGFGLHVIIKIYIKPIINHFCHIGSRTLTVGTPYLSLLKEE